METTSQGTHGATPGLPRAVPSQPSGVPGPVPEVALQALMTPTTHITLTTPTSREGTSSRTFDQTPSTLMYQEGTNSHISGQTPTTLTFKEETSSHTFGHTPSIPMSREETNSHTSGQATVSPACQVLSAAPPSKTLASTIKALCLTWRPVMGTLESHK